MKDTKRSVFGVACVVVFLSLIVALGHAQTIDQSNSPWVWQGLIPGDAVQTCPAGDGATSIFATVRQTGGALYPGVRVWLEYVDNDCGIEPYICLAEGITNGDGEVTLYPRIGLDRSGSDGCCQLRVHVKAECPVQGDVNLKTPAGNNFFPDIREWVSFDLNGDGVVNGAPDPDGWGDVIIFAEDYPGYGCRSDFNGDDGSNLSDYAILTGHIADHPALSMNPPGEVTFGTMDPETTDSRVITLKNTGGAPLNWQLIESCPLITSISPSSGTLAIPSDDNGTTQEVIIEIDTAELSGPQICEVDIVSDSSYECLIDDPIIVTADIPTGPMDRVFDAGGDGFTWTDGLNWDPDGVPGSNDHAKILLDGTYTIFYNSVSGIYALTHGAMNGVQTLDIQTGTLGVTDGATNTQKIILRDDATLDVSAGGDTALVINDASGTFVLDNGDLVGAGRFLNRGHLRKTGDATSHVTMFLQNGEPGRASEALISVEAGTLSIEGGFDNYGRMTVNSGATAITSGHFRVISDEVTVEAGGEFVVADTVVVTSTGALDVSGLLSVEVGGLLLNSGDVNIREGGSLTVDGELTNEVDGQLVNSGLVYVSEGGLLTNDGYFDHGENAVLTGDGTIDNTLGIAAIKGLVAPGDQEGTLTFLGDFVQSATSEISLEIGGYDQGVTFDHLDVSGLATLDGAIAVTLTNGFEPVVGDTFQTITHAGPGPGGTSFYCYSGLTVSDSLYLDPLHLTGEFVLRAIEGSAGNQSPVAVDDDASVMGYQPITLDVLANDTDPDLNDLRVILLNTVTLSGIAYINEDDLLVTYAAVPGHAGADSFDYVVTDCYGGADIGRVRINVTAPPEVWQVPDDSPTIAGALALAAPGDTVVVASGTYYEYDVAIPSGVYLVGETGDPDDVVVDASGSAAGVFYCVDASGATVIRGITAMGGTTAQIGGGLYCIRSSPQVIDCVFAGNEAGAGGGVACYDNSSATFVGCRIEGNSSAMGGGVLCRDSSSPVFSQCIISENLATASGGGVQCDSLAALVLESCTLVGNTAPAAAGSGFYVDGSSSATVDGTIVAFGLTGEAVACGASGVASFTCSDVFGNAGGDWVGCISGQGAIDGNFSLDPAFCDTALGDFHLVPASPCADAPGCGLVGALEAGCLEFPEIDVSPTSLTFELESGNTASDLLEISNLGRSDLIWMIRESDSARNVSDRRSAPVKARILPREIAAALELVNPEILHVELAKGEDDTRVGRGPIRGAGGPDGFGYTWIDSDDPSGPAYNWREISGVGTALTLTDDDHTDVILPFLFPFYASQKVSVKISSNGYLTFGQYADDYSNDPIPDPWAPNDVVAPFWDDINPELGGDVYYYHDAVEEEFIVQYDGIYDYFGAGPYTFEVILKPDGSIHFLYDQITGSPTTATVGIEDSSGTTGLEIAFNAAYVHAPLAIVIEDPAPWLTRDTPSGATSGLGTSSVVIEVDTEGLAAGIYPVTLVIESDDPDEPEVMIPVTLTIDVVGVDDGLPTRYVLYGNYPNPFNPMTDIHYDLPAPGAVTLRVYSIAGRLVRELVRGEQQAPGTYRIPWDGRDESGESVASGVYFYKLEAGGEVLSKRMVLLK